MQIAQDNAPVTPGFGVALTQADAGTRSPYSDYKIIRRNGAVVGFEPGKISVAMTKAFLAVNGAQGAASARIREVVGHLTDAVCGALMRRQPAGGTFHIEDIQDQVELALMRSGEHDVARAYVLYREERAKARAQEKAAKKVEPGIHVVEDGRVVESGRHEDLLRSGGRYASFYRLQLKEQEPDAPVAAVAS